MLLVGMNFIDIIDMSFLAPSPIRIFLQSKLNWTCFSSKPIPTDPLQTKWKPDQNVILIEINLSVRT
jgi:hypothetical protein